MGDFDRESGTLVVNKRIYQARIDTPKTTYGVRTIKLTRQLVRELAERK